MTEPPHDVVTRTSAVPAPGELASLTAGGWTLALANVEGELYAFEDNCTHEDCPLSAGDLDGHLVVCMCHGGTFDVRTGEPVDGPVYVPVRTFTVGWDGDSAVVRTPGPSQP